MIGKVEVPEFERFLSMVFSHGKEPVGLVSFDDIWAAKTGKCLLELIQDSGQTRKALTLIKRGLKQGKGRVELLERGLAVEGLVSALEQAEPKARELMILRQTLVKWQQGRQQGFPQLTALLDGWWRKQHPHAVDSRAFQESWDAWTQGEPDFTAEQHARFLAQWRNERLCEIAEHTSARKATPTSRL